MVGTAGGVTSNRPTVHVEHAGQTSSIEEILPFQWWGSYHRILLQENHSVGYFHCQTEGIFSRELLAAFLKARPRRQHSHWQGRGAACRLPCHGELAAFILWPMGETPGRPQGQAAHAAQHSTAQQGPGHTQLIVPWITNSLMYNSLPVRITTRFGNRYSDEHLAFNSFYAFSFWWHVDVLTLSYKRPSSVDRC